MLSQAGVVAALREDLASQELSEAGTEVHGPALVPTNLQFAIVTGVQGPVSTEAPAEEVSGHLA